jgi:hypothetical protein
MPGDPPQEEVQETQEEAPQRRGREKEEVQEEKGAPIARHLVRRLLLASVGALVALAAAGVSSAGAAVTIGQTFTPEDSFGGSGVFIQSASPGNSYAAPSDGVITSWSFEAPAGITPPMKLKVVRPAGGADFTTVGDSQLETPMPGILNTWTTRIAVKAGDLPSHFYTDTTTGFRNDATGYDTHYIDGAPGDPDVDPPPGTTVTYQFDAGDQIDLSTVLEADADHDGFGDETQDKCPSNASTQGTCPVPHKKKCKKRKKHRSAEAAKKKKCKKKRKHR